MWSKAVGVKILFFASLCSASIDHYLTPGQDDEALEQLVNLHKHWYLGAVNGLIGAMEKKMRNKLPAPYRRELRSCLEDTHEHDVKTKAKCMSKAFDLKRTRQEIKELKWVGGFALLDGQPGQVTKASEMIQITNSTSNSSPEVIEEQVNSTVSSSTTTTDASTSTSTSASTSTSTSTSPSTLTSTSTSTMRSTSRRVKQRRRKGRRRQRIRGRKGRRRKGGRRRRPQNRTKSSSTPRPRLRGLARLRWLNSLARRRRTRRQAKVTHMRRMPNLARRPHQLPISRILQQLLFPKGPKTNPRQWRAKFNKLQRYAKLSKVANRQQSQVDAMMSRVLGRKTAGNSGAEQETSFLNELFSIFGTQGNLTSEQQSKFVQELLSLIAGSDVGSVRLFSPKFLSVVDDEMTNVLSPSLFSFDNTSSNALLSLPSLFGGLDDSQRDTWLQLIMETSGAEESVDKILDYFEEPTSANQRDAVLKTTVKMVDKWDRLYKTYSTKQRSKMDREGYAFLDTDQLELLYGSESVFNVTDSQLDIDIDKYSRMSDADREEALESIIRSIAGEELHPALKSWNRRLKQITLTPLVLNPLILSPLVLGPVTLSPLVFTPIILSPYVLTPITLDPGVGNPVLLSPFALSPWTLSPQVLSPFILSPFALSPFTLMPVVLTPVILAPFVLSPITLTPIVLGGLYLSPYALSPITLSPVVVSAIVLSPSILS